MSSAPGSPESPLAFDGDSTRAPLAAAPAQPNPIAWISFAGAPNESAASFVQSVQRIAFLQNRIEDDKWTAQYASTCFTDSALVWHFRLDEDIQSSWRKLRIALVRRYPSQTSPQPTPPASTWPSSFPISTGRIEVIRPEFGNFFGYLSQDSAGEFVVDPNPAKALMLEKVLHIDSKYQHEKIYSLKLLNAPDPQFPFLGLELLKLSGEDPDTLPLADELLCSSGLVARLPCCKMASSFNSVDGSSRFRSQGGWATWNLVQTTESGPGPYYIRKAQGADENARVVSAVWTTLQNVNDVEGLSLVWPEGDNRYPDSISTLGLEAVLHKGGIAGLHVHADRFTEGLSRNLDESRVVFLFRRIPNFSRLRSPVYRD